MFKEKRLDEILKHIINSTEATVEELAERFNVSNMTIRRDLNTLEQSGLISRTHGGAISNNLLHLEERYEQKQSKNADIKNRIAKAAMQLIHEESIIFLDAGTTTYYIASLLSQHFKNLTIFTNDIKIASELYTSDFQIYITGGRVQSETGCIMGQMTNSFISALNFDISFIGTSAINQDLFLLTPSEEKALNKKNIIQKAPVNVLVCDHSKFEQRGLFNIVSADTFDYIITNYKFNASQSQQLENKTTRIIYV